MYDYTKPFDKDEVLEIQHGDTGYSTEELAREALNAEPKPEPVYDELHGVTKTRLRMRNVASTGEDSEVVTTLAQGQKVIVIDEFNDDWYYVMTLDEKHEGYCMSKFIELV